MTNIDAAFILLVLALATALIARKVSIPEPVFFAIVGIAGGIVWHSIPGLPAIRMPPEIVLFAFLPPLLTGAAYAIPLAAFRRNLLPIGMLAVGLVLLTAGVAATVGHTMAGLTWPVAMVLGFIVAPPDPVAATTVAARTGLSHRLVVILEGEGLVNDAVAIVAYGIALDVVGSGSVSWSHALLALAHEVPIGILVGLAGGWGAARIRSWTESVPLEIGISLVTPYLAYHLATRLGGSAVLAVVTLGFMLRASTLRVSSPVARLAARTVWSFIGYGSTALVFLLLGLLIGDILMAWPGWNIVGAGAALAAAVIAVRMLWMLIVPRLTRIGRRRAPSMTRSEQLVLGWSGMRGVVSLALALALPTAFASDTQSRHAIIFMTLIVIIATLIVQGVTLAPLMRWLEVGDRDRDAREERHARKLAARVGICAARAALRESDVADTQAEAKLVGRIADGSMGIADPYAAGSDSGQQRVLLRALDTQRKVVSHLRDSGRMSGAISERLDTEIDLDAMNVSGDGKRLTSGGLES